MTPKRWSGEAQAKPGEEPAVLNAPLAPGNGGGDDVAEPGANSAG